MLKSIKGILFENRGAAQRIFKNTFWLASAEIVGKFLGFLFLILVARYLGVAGYGQLSFALGFVALFSIIINFGLDTLTIRAVARKKKLVKKYLGNIISLKLVLAVITFALITLVLQPLGKPIEIQLLVYLAAVSVIINSFGNFLKTTFRAFEKMELEAFPRIAQSACLLIIGIFVVFFNLGIMALMHAYIIAATVGFILALSLVWNKISHFWISIDFAFWKETLKKSWPFALSVIFVSIYYYLDTIMLSVMKTDVEVGLYNAAYKPILFLIVFSGFFVHSVFPIISRLYKESLDKLQRMVDYFTKLIVILAVPLAFGGTILASHIILLLYGSEFLGGVLVFQILIWAAAITYINTVYAYSLQACDRQKQFMYAVALGALINVIANFLLIPIYSLYGAAIATLLTKIFLVVFIFYQLRKVVSVRIFGQLYKPLIASIIMFGLLFLIANLHLFVQFIAGAVVYFVALVALKGISQEDISIIKGIFQVKT